MSILTKETDLLQFINKKKQAKFDVGEKKILTNYCKVLTNALVKCYEKLSIGKYSINCMETINYLFWILFLYSKNLKLTMFLCDRAILLFNEYILMTKNTISSSSSDNINLSDVKAFVYKKTIGPLTINNLNFVDNPMIKICNSLREIITVFIIQLIRKNTSSQVVPIEDMNNVIESIFNSYIDYFLEEYNSNREDLFTLVEEFIELDKFTDLEIKNMYLALSLLFQLYSKNCKKYSQCDYKLIQKDIKKYYNSIFINTEKYSQKNNSLKKDITNIKVDEVFKLLEKQN